MVDLFEDDNTADLIPKKKNEVPAELIPESSKDAATPKDTVRPEILQPQAERVVKGPDGFPCLLGDDYPEAYLTMVKRIWAQYSLLPSLDYNKIYKEMAELTIKSSPTPTLQVINQEIQRAQAAKERLSEIMVDILKCYTLKKRAVDILTEAWNNFSSCNSADKRKGDAIYRLSDFDLDFSQAESALKVAVQIARNLDSLQDSLSRRITIFQLQLKLHDMGRNALPDFDFKDDLTDGLNSMGKKSGGLEAEERDF